MAVALTPKYFMVYRLLLACMLPLSCAHAEPKSPESNALIKKAQGIIRELSQQKNTLEAEKTAWLAEKFALSAEIDALRAAARRSDSLQAELARTQTAAAALQQNLSGRIEQSRQREHTLEQKYRQLTGQAQAVRDDNLLLVEAVRERERWITQCGDKNRQLRETAEDIVRHYRDKGVLQTLAELEPFTGIADVAGESAAEDYRYRLRQLKVTPYESEEGGGAANP